MSLQARRRDGPSVSRKLSDRRGITSLAGRQVRNSGLPPGGLIVSIKLSAVGRLAEAVAAAEEAVLRYRRLADTNPATYGPDLARALLAVAQIRVTS